MIEIIVFAVAAAICLAGALGVPTWLATSTNPDWRWFREGDGSPWYPSFRLFRQNRAGQWSDVFLRMADELRRSV